MAIRGERAKSLLEYLLLELTPYLPGGVTVEVGRSLRGKRYVLRAFRHADIRYGELTLTVDAYRRPVRLEYRSVSANAFGAMLPMLPRLFVARGIAEDAVGMILGLAYATAEPAAVGLDFDVKAAVAGERVMVTFRVPNVSEGSRLVVPIPLQLLDPKHR